MVEVENGFMLFQALSCLRLSLGKGLLHLAQEDLWEIKTEKNDTHTHLELAEFEEKRLVGEEVDVLGQVVCACLRQLLIRQYLLPISKPLCVSGARGDRCP